MLTSSRPRALIVGAADDVHVASVVREVVSLGAPEPLTFDAARLATSDYELGDRALRVDDVRVSLDEGTGWLRRYGPAGWVFGDRTGSLDALVKRSHLALVTGIARSARRRWLTGVDALLAAEDKLLQLRAARELGFAIPPTLVTTDQSRAHEQLGDPMVVKPLVGGFFLTDDGAKAVFASLLAAHQAPLLDFGAAPFLAQRLMRVRRHLRVVTVGQDVWAAELKPEGDELDWREVERNHRAWRGVDDDDLAERASRLAAAMNIGFSSQDWVDTGDETVFLDLNPGGQWLFLPVEVSDAVTQRVARFLVGGRSA